MRQLGEETEHQPIEGGRSNRDVCSPTMMNSTGMKTRRKWNIIFRTGHSVVFMSLHPLGESTRVSQAATVNVHTKKYLCADRCGGKLREGGRREVMSDMFSLVNVDGGGGGKASRRGVVVVDEKQAETRRRGGYLREKGWRGGMIISRSRECLKP